MIVFVLVKTNNFVNLFYKVCEKSALELFKWKNKELIPLKIFVFSQDFLLTFEQASSIRNKRNQMPS